MLFQDIANKPKAVRKQYAFWSAASLTTAIAIVWAVSLQYRFDDSVTAEIAVDEPAGAFAQFFSDAKENFANVISSGETTIENSPAQLQNEATNVAPVNERRTLNSARIVPPAASTAPTSAEAFGAQQNRSVRVETESTFSQKTASSSGQE